MLIALPLAVAIVVVLAWRQGDGPGGRRMLLGIGALALGVRLLATLVISTIADQSHVTKVWLNDEASFFLATQALLPNPLDRVLPQGLDHLGGDGYLGLTTALSILGGGVADANTFRVVNSALGAIVVVLSTLVARRLFGVSAAVVTGVALSVWPTLVLWSATMLRDTMGSVAVVVVWWALGRARDLGWIRTLGTISLSLVIVLSLRPYLGGAILVGVLAWAAYPFARKLRAQQVALLGAGTLVAMLAIGIVMARRVDYAAHELLYRQTITKLETLGRLYTDYPPTAADLPIKPGAAVGMYESGGWVLGGVVQDFSSPTVVRVAFTDETIRDVPLDQLLPLQSTTIPPLELVAWVGPNLAGYLLGTSVSSDTTSPAWTATALAWDALVVLAVVAVVRKRLGPREWLYSLCVVGGTALALIAVPGAPGNTERHRATQTVPLLLVLGSALVADWELLRRASGLAVSAIRTTPASEAAPASSRMRSAR